MGRTLKRVPMDFDWERNKIWKGYSNPHYVPCPWCNGYGWTEVYKRFEDFTRRLTLAAEQSINRPNGFVPSILHENKYRHAEIKSQYCRWPWHQHDPVDVLLKIAGWSRDKLTDDDIRHIHYMARTIIPKKFCKPQFADYVWEGHVRKTVIDSLGGVYYPHPYLCEEDGIADIGPNFHEFVAALGGKNDGNMGWGGEWDIQKAIMKEVGIEFVADDDGWERTDWGKCEACNGKYSHEDAEGIHPDHREAYLNWEEYDPPEGEGFQLWETTSEGSPVSPVFETIEELCEWCAENATTFASCKATAEQWRKMLDGDFVHHKQGNMIFT